MSPAVSATIRLVAHTRSTSRGGRSRAFALGVAILAGACGGAQEPLPQAAEARLPRPSILLVTLDTTRADAIGPEARGVETPAFNALAARGRRFRQAYATVPETLPSHASMLTGLFPAGHGIHENARYLDAEHPVLAERLRDAGYETAAFVSSFVLAGASGSPAGSSVYDDELPPAGPSGTLGAGHNRPSPRVPRTGGRRSLGSSGCTTSIRTPRMCPGALPIAIRPGALPGRGRGHGRAAGPVAARRSSSRAPGPRPSCSWPTTGKGWAITARPSTGTSSTSPTMHVPLVIVGPGVDRRLRRDASLRAPRLPHGARLGRSGGGPSLRGSRVGARPGRGHEAVPLATAGSRR